jgi:hypothetical protein
VRHPFGLGQRFVVRLSFREEHDGFIQMNSCAYVNRGHCAGLKDSSFRCRVLG